MAASHFVPLLIGGIVLGVLLILAAVLIPILVVSRRRRMHGGPGGDYQTAGLGQALSQLEMSGERGVLPATPCHLRIGHATRPSARAALTTGRVIWNWRGKGGELRLGELRDVHEASSYNGETRYGVTWVVFSGAGQEVGLGFQTGEHARWLEQVRGLIGGARPS